jgi:hypothetical protein
MEREHMRRKEYEKDFWHNNRVNHFNNDVIGLFGID